MATHHLLSIFIALTVISLVRAVGITIDLIHRDSPSSPLSNSATSHVDKLYNTFQRSILRAREIARATRAKPSAINAPVLPTSGEYLVDIGIGTPPKRFLGIVDTGSDLTWTQCKPCVLCFEQDQPFFDPSGSTSYGTLTCRSNACDALSPNNQGCTANNTCAYKYGYGDKSYTIGDLATETLTIGGFGSSSPTAQIRNFAFGCGHQNQGIFEIPTTGIVGLGQGMLSLPSQTKHIPAFGGKFAYCLIPFEGGFKEDVKSKMSFGDDAVVYGDNVVSTPVVSGEDSTFYYLTLEGVSVADQTLIPFRTRNGLGSGLDKKDVDEGEGNMIIDSGATLTFLPEEMFNELVSELRPQIKAETVQDPKGTLKLCYDDEEIEVPKITFHFTEADLGLGFKNTFIPVGQNVICLAMLPTDHFGIFGNWAHTNFVVGHDLDAKTVTFKPTDCKTFVP